MGCLGGTWMLGEKGKGYDVMIDVCAFEPTSSVGCECGCCI
jgi:hypothetical protein